MTIHVFRNCLGLILLILGWTVTHNSIMADEQYYGCKPERIQITAGHFSLGSQNTIFKDEQPQHDVQIQSFKMSKYETTVYEFFQWIKAENIPYPYLDILKKEIIMNPCKPINYVSWDQASAFCIDHGGRLPTEAEWEYAATIDVSVPGVKHPWETGPEFPLLASEAISETFNAMEEDSYDEGEEDNEDEDDDDAYNELDFDFESNDKKCITDYLMEVHRSVLGINQLQGMLGNLWEWTGDWYGPYTAQNQNNPTGPETGFWKVLKGGSYQNIDQKLLMRPTLRNKAGKNERFNHVGFRCVWPNTN